MRCLQAEHLSVGSESSTSAVWYCSSLTSLPCFVPKNRVTTHVLAPSRRMQPLWWHSSFCRAASNEVSCTREVSKADQSRHLWTKVWHFCGIFVASLPSLCSAGRRAPKLSLPSSLTSLSLSAVSLFMSSPFPASTLLMVPIFLPALPQPLPPYTLIAPVQRMLWRVEHWQVPQVKIHKRIFLFLKRISDPNKSNKCVMPLYLDFFIKWQKFSNRAPIYQYRTSYPGRFK